jgi:hypothetical protein
MTRYSLRTLLIVLAIGPMLIYFGWLAIDAILFQIRANFLARGIGT